MNTVSNGISLCMIVKNEQENLPKSLQAAREYVDEIIIVDTGSTDDSVEIAKSFGARVYYFEWGNDFSAARNFALQYATKNWVLNLDADHIIKVNQTVNLMDILKNTGKLAFFIEEQSVDETGKAHGLERLLLFRNFRGFYYEGIIHEHPGNAVSSYADAHQITDPLGRLSGVTLLHHGYDDPLKKLNRNLPILRDALKKTPDDYHYLYKYLLTLKSLKNTSFEKELKKASALILHENPPLRASVIGIWGMFGDWVYHYNVQDSQRVFLSGAQQIGERIDWSDYRLVKPVIRILEKKGEYEYSLDLIRHCLLRGIAPRHVAITEYDRFDALYQLLRLHNTHSDVNTFMKDMKKLDVYMEKANIDPDSFDRYLREIDGDLWETLGILQPKSKKAQAKRPLLTLCLIVKNEQSNIKRCLQSVSGVCEEIIVVDTGSNDRTIEIAQAYTDKIYRHDWNGDFSAARNAALEKATGRWILHLDADEALEPVSAKTVRAFIQDCSHQGVNIIVRNYQPDQDMVKYLDEFQVRLFQNKKKVCYENRIHEQIVPSIKRIGGSLGDSALRIDHFGYMHKNAQRNERNLRLLNEQLAEHPMDSYTLFKLGEAYKAENDLDKAGAFLARAIRNPTGNLTNEIREIIYLRLAQIELARNNYNEAGQYADGCLRFNSQSYIALYIRGIVDMYMGNTDKALECFNQVKASSAKHSLDLSDMERLIDALQPNTPLMN